jgi:hypothetical protein
MVRDPFYRQILASLSEPLDPQTFEACMGDILRNDLPGLVPVLGGSDSGFDGAFAEAEGEFPLVCTTGKNVVRNLSKSLDSAKKNSPARKVAFATSRRLTPPQRTQLKRLALDRGYLMVLLVEQRGVAYRLYRNSAWCKDLLGLDGYPSPLSVVPSTRRPLIEISPVGRDEDMEWLRARRQDCVLSGEPGSGKTFLLYHLMQHEWPGLFLSSQDFDEAAIANALRDQKPKFIVVDDAHAEPDRLVNLRRLRKEIGSSFWIVATTWTGGREEVMDALGIAAPQARRLELLTRDEILSVIQQVGVREDEHDNVLRHMVDQAANKPGLAVTIASLWLQGAWQEFVEGTALSRSLNNFFDKFVGKESTDVLAAFSLGGDRGMPQEVVREYLELDRPRFRRIVLGLAAGGALFEAGADTLKVIPPVLRAPLLRSVFFPDQVPSSYEYRKLLEKAPSRATAIEGLVRARRQGAQIPLAELRELVSSVDSPRAWREFASLDVDAALWALQSYPGDVVRIAREALEAAPEPTINKLLERAVNAPGPLNSQPDHPMRILQGWVKELDIPPAEMIRRRKLLARAGRRFLLDGGQRAVGIQGLFLSLSPGVESHTQGPGSGDVLHLRWGLMPVEGILQMGSIWEYVYQSLDRLGLADWEHLSAALWDWIYPDYSAKHENVPKEQEEAMKAFAEKALQDLAMLAHGSPGLASGLKDLARRVNLDLSLEGDEAFDLLFPPPSDELPDESLSAYREPLHKLAQAWSREDPDKVAERLARYEEDALFLQRRWPRRSPELAAALAALIVEPVLWAEAFSRWNVPGDVVQPFLGKMMRAQEDTWEIQAEHLVSRPEYLWSVAEKVLPLSSPPGRLLERIVKKLAQRPDLVEIFCLRNQVSTENLRILLRCAEITVALAAAVGEWESDPLGEVREAVLADWRGAILRAKTADFLKGFKHQGLQQSLARILAQDPALAFEWLVTRLRESAELWRISDRGPVAKALSVLGREQKLRLLDELSGKPVARGFIAALVGQDLEIYKRLLSLEPLKRHAWEPLARVPDEAWMELALLALNAGFSAREIANASFALVGVVTFWEPESDHWIPWEEAFSRLEDDTREDAREIAKLGRQIAVEKVRKARESERQRAIRE